MLFDCQAVTKEKKFGDFFYVKALNMRILYVGQQRTRIRAHIKLVPQSLLLCFDEFGFRQFGCCYSRVIFNLNILLPFKTYVIKITSRNLSYCLKQTN